MCSYSLTISLLNFKSQLKFWLFVSNKPKLNENISSVTISIGYFTFLSIAITLTKAAYFILGRKVRNASVAPALKFHASAMLLILTLGK